MRLWPNRNRSRNAEAKQKRERCSANPATMPNSQSGASTAVDAPITLEKASAATKTTTPTTLCAAHGKEVEVVLPMADLRATVGSVQSIASKALRARVARNRVVPPNLRATLA